MEDVCTAIRDLADVLETVETVGTTEVSCNVLSLMPETDNLLAYETIRAELGVRVPLFTIDDSHGNLSLTPKEVSLEDDGSLRMELLISATSDAPRRDAETPHAESERADPRSEAESDSEGESASPVATEGRPTSDLDADKATGETDARTYRDVDRLRAVYEEYDTFAEMTEALDVDVTSQTVRRHMIEYGIHEPASGTGSDTAGALLDADAELPSETADGPPVSESTSDGSSEVRGPGDGEMMADGEGAVTESDATAESELTVDGSGESGKTPRPADAVPDDGTDLDVDLPDHLTLEDIKVTVQEAQTLYEAQQQLDLDRDETRRLLQRLNLLDLVHGRAATRDIVSRTVEDINQRLQSTVRPEPDRT